MAKEGLESRALHWQQLSVMLSAGIAPAVAVKTLTETPNSDNRALTRVADLLARGQSMSAALTRSKLLSKHDLATIGYAEEAGLLADGFDHIASDHIARSNNKSSLETGLLFPQVILLIAAIAALSIRIFQFQQPLIAATVSVSMVVILFLLATRVFVFLWSLNPRVWLGLLWPLSFLKKNSAWFQNHFEYHFYRHLSWQLGAGVPAEVAVRRSDNLILNNLYQRQLNGTGDSISNGYSIPASLINGGLVLSNRMQQSLVVGSETGAFDASLNTELSRLKGVIEARVKEQIKWLPKIYYFVVVVVIFTYLF